MRDWRRFFAKPDPAHAADHDLPVMSFGSHLEELRRRLILALLGAFVGVAVCLYFANDIIGFLYRPYLLALHQAGYAPHLTYAKPAGSIIMYFMTAFKAGFVLSSPWIFYQFWQFIAAGLFRRERLIVYRYIGPSIVLFLAGIVFFFCFVLPVMLKIFLEFNQQVQIPSLTPNSYDSFLYGPAATQPAATMPAGDQSPLLNIPIVRSDPTHFAPGQVSIWYNAVDGELRMHVADRTLDMQTQPSKGLFSPIPMMDDYMSFVTVMCLVFGFSFELPMVMMILAQLGIVSPGQFGKFWRFAVLALAIFAAILAPTPDVLTFSSIFVPLLALYILGLLLALLAVRKKPVRDQQK
jgi:sec-independent protein translocase protein TatC